MQNEWKVIKEAVVWFRVLWTAVGSRKPRDLREAVKEGVSRTVAESVEGRGKNGTAVDSRFCSLGVRPIQTPLVHVAFLKFKQTVSLPS